jgi:hypothetical protein
MSYRKVFPRSLRKRKPISGYSRFRSAHSVVPRLRNEPDELTRKMLLIGYLTERLEKENPESLYVVVARPWKRILLASSRQAILTS